jgi:hypothetical protein
LRPKRQLQQQPKKAKRQQEAGDARRMHCNNVQAMAGPQANGIIRATSTTFCVCSTRTLTASRRSSTP